MSKFMAIFESTLRDTRKNKEYFSRYIKDQYARIDAKIAKLQDASGDKKQRILMSLIGYYVDLLKAEYSNGASKRELKTLLIKALDVVGEYTNATYDDILTLISLSVILGAQSDTKKLVNSNKSSIDKDRLLTYLVNNGKEWDTSIPLNSKYSSLNSVFKDDQESAMESYVKNWYDSHSDSAWYNRHKSDSDTYAGYGCFEAAAIVKLLNISDSKLVKYDTYPKF